LQEKNVSTNANGVALSAAATPTTRLDRSAWLSLRTRFGRGLWRRLHRMADGWPCSRCQPRM